jgi:hypothetical protein
MAALGSQLARSPNNIGFVSGYFSVTGEYHQNMQGVLNYLEERVADTDVFVTTVFQPVLNLEFQVPNRRIFYYSSKKKTHIKALQQIIKKHKTGWVILDARRFGSIDRSGFPTVKGRRARIENKTVRLVFEEDEARIYRWQP